MHLVGHLSNPSPRLLSILRLSNRRVKASRRPRLSPQGQRRLGNGVVERAIIRVLTSADAPMRTGDIQASVEHLLGHPVAKESVSWSLRSGCRGEMSRFECVAYATYRLRIPPSELPERKLKSYLVWKRISEPHAERPDQPTVRLRDMRARFAAQGWFVVLAAVALGVLVTGCGATASRSTTARVKTVAHPVSAELTKPTGVATTCGEPPFVERPAELSFSCDGNVVFKDVRWGTWGGAQAHGSGTLYLIGNECVPNCAEAPRYQYPVRLVASEIAVCGSRRVYGLVTAYLTEPDYMGKRSLSNRLQRCESPEERAAHKHPTVAESVIAREAPSNEEVEAELRRMREQEREHK